jgi:hypothetical protein
MVGNSNHVMLGKAFLIWKECDSAAELKRYCKRVDLAFNTMREILVLTRQLDLSLTTLGFQRTTVCNKMTLCGKSFVLFLLQHYHQHRLCMYNAHWQTLPR